MGKMNMRKAYGEALLELGRENGKIVALEADLGKSTMSNMFGGEFPQRYFQMGIAEANMISAAAGLALTGHVAYASTFAVFASGRKTHQSVDDIALMRVLPNMKVFSPADYYETRKIVKAMAGIDGPCYIRVNRNDVPVVTDPDAPFECGKVSLMRDGGDVVIYATGFMVYQSLEAAKLLENEGISAKVINVATIKPLDAEGIIDAAKGMKAAVTVEEASVIGGLGSAVCETLAAGPAQSRVRTLRMGIQDLFGTSAQKYEELLRAYHLTPEDIVAKVKEALK